MAPHIPMNVKKWASKPYKLRSRLPNMAVQGIAPEGNNPTGNPPRIQPMTGQTQYGKKTPAAGFGTTGLTGES
jgi:hypothetical protein